MQRTLSLASASVRIGRAPSFLTASTFAALKGKLREPGLFALRSPRGVYPEEVMPLRGTTKDENARSRQYWAIERAFSREPAKDSG